MESSRAIRLPLLLWHAPIASLISFGKIVMFRQHLDLAPAVPASLKNLGGGSLVRSSSRKSGLCQSCSSMVDQATGNSNQVLDPLLHSTCAAEDPRLGTNVCRSRARRSGSPPVACGGSVDWLTLAVRTCASSAIHCRVFGGVQGLNDDRDFHPRSARVEYATNK